MPVYNQQAGLLSSLSSIEAEAIPADIVIVDDGSDPPITLPSRHKAVILRNNENRGIESALNLGLEYILQGPYKFVARLDAGDMSVNGRLGKQVAFLAENPEYGLVASYAEFVELSGRFAFRYLPPTAHDAILNRMRYKTCFIHPAMMMRVSALRRVGLYRCGFPAAEDYELAFRIASHYKVANLGEVLVRTEVNPKGISATRRTRQLLSRVQVQLAYFRADCLASYLGLVFSLFLFMIPSKLLLFLKRSLKAA